MPEVDPPQRRRSEKSRIAIFDATLSLIEEVGYDRLTMEGIAARAKVGKQTLYRWWSSKATLVVDVVLSTEGTFVWPERCFDQTAESDLVSWTIEMVRAHTIEPRVSMMQAMMTASSTDPTVAERVYERFGHPALLQLTQLLQESAPEADSEDVALAAEMFVGAFAQRRMGTGQAVTEEFGRGVLHTLLRSLRAPTSQRAQKH